MAQLSGNQIKKSSPIDGLLRLQTILDLENYIQNNDLAFNGQAIWVINEGAKYRITDVGSVGYEPTGGELLRWEDRSNEPEVLRNSDVGKTLWIDNTSADKDGHSLSIPTGLDKGWHANVRLLGDGAVVFEALPGTTIRTRAGTYSPTGIYAIVGEINTSLEVGRHIVGFDDNVSNYSSTGHWSITAVDTSPSVGNHTVQLNTAISNFTPNKTYQITGKDTGPSVGAHTIDFDAAISNFSPKGSWSITAVDTSPSVGSHTIQFSVSSDISGEFSAGTVFNVFDTNDFSGARQATLTVNSSTYDPDGNGDLQVTVDEDASAISTSDYVIKGISKFATGQICNVWNSPDFQHTHRGTFTTNATTYNPDGNGDIRITVDEDASAVDPTNPDQLITGVAEFTERVFSVWSTTDFSGTHQGHFRATASTYNADGNGDVQATLAEDASPISTSDYVHKGVSGYSKGTTVSIWSTTGHDGTYKGTFTAAFSAWDSANGRLVVQPEEDLSGAWTTDYVHKGLDVGVVPFQYGTAMLEHVGGDEFILEGDVS